MNTQPGGVSLSYPVRLLAGGLLIVVPAGFTAFFTLLQIRFDYPEILRKPASEVLVRFSEQQGSVLPLWCGMLASALLFIPLSVAVASVLRQTRGGTGALLVFGVLAGLVQSVGLARWVFAVPILAARYTGSTLESEKHAVALVFDTLNVMLGVGIGEQFGYMFTTAWTLLLAWMMRASRPFMSLVGGCAGVAIAVGLLEAAGMPWAGAVNAIGYSVWSLWLIWIGVLVLAGKPLAPTR